MKREESNKTKELENMSFEEGFVKDLYTDVYNGQVFSSAHKFYLRWCKPLGGWLINNKKFWEVDRNGLIKRWAIETYKLLKDYLQNFPKDKFGQDDLKIFAGHVKSSGSNGKLESMIECSKTYLSAKAEDFDKNHNLFNCQNCTINLATGESYQFKADDFITKISNVHYDPLGKCPQWEIFLKDIFLDREDLIYFIQQVIGYCLCGEITEQCFFLFYGAGNNGKTTFLEVVEYLLGEYARHCPSSTLMKKQAGSMSNDIARLKGARFINACEKF